MAPTALIGLPPSPGHGTPPDVVAQVEDLRVGYPGPDGEVPAVRGVGLTVRRGEVLALVGESGSGKSSVAAAVLGLLGERGSTARVGGRVTVLDEDMLGPPSAGRRRLRRSQLGAVFQDPGAALDPTMTIGRQVGETTGGDVGRTTALLERVRLSQARRRLRSYPHEISGGQRQRVLIAMAVAGEPRLVVADEPTTALDVTVQATVLDLLGELRDRLGCALLLVTHDLAVAAQVADRVAVCYAGRVVETGPARAVLERPAHPYTAGLLGSRITLDAPRDRPLPVIPGEPPAPRHTDRGCAFAPRCPHVRPSCRERVPPPEDVADDPGHTAACLRIGEFSGRGGDGPPEPPVAPPVRARPGGAVVVRVRDLHTTFRLRPRRARVRALAGVDLDLAAGDCVAVVGESGSGKSTLLRVVAGLVRPDRGSVDRTGPGRPQMVFQDAGSSLTPWLTVGEQLRERHRAAAGDDADVDGDVASVLDRVGLGPDVLGRRPAQLSGGQRQRVAIARAVVVPPPVLLCDEPTSSLDASLAAAVLNLLGDCRRELGTAVLLVTHDVAVARYAAGRIVVLKDGAVVEHGRADDVVSRPAHPYTRALVDAVPRLRAPAGGPGDPS